jgi:hypothetical protein
MGNQWTDSQGALTENRLEQMSDPVDVLYSDGNTAVSTATRHYICTVPAYSIIKAVYYRRAVAFNAAGDDFLTVGTESDDDLLVDDADISAAAATIPVVVNTTTLPYYVSADTPIYATYVYSSTAPTTGEVEVAIEWVPWNLKPRETL